MVSFKTMTRAVAFTVALSSAPAFAAEITGAGSTFAYPILAKWADAYKKQTGNGLNYQSIGSGAGIKQIEAGTVTFGASDQPLKQDVLDKNGLTQFPFTMGGIVPVLNLQGVSAGELVIDGPTLAAIYLGKVTKWNDPALAKLNPKAKLPNLAITVVERSDGSGTTFNFADYLSKASADWKSQVGENTSLQWPTGIGAKGNEGVFRLGRPDERARSAMSNTPTPSRISSSTWICSTRTEIAWRRQWRRSRRLRPMRTGRARPASIRS